MFTLRFCLLHPLAPFIFSLNYADRNTWFIREHSWTWIYQKYFTYKSNLDISEWKLRKHYTPKLELIDFDHSLRCVCFTYRLMSVVVMRFCIAFHLEILMRPKSLHQSYRCNSSHSPNTRPNALKCFCMVYVSYYSTSGFRNQKFEPAVLESWVARLLRSLLLFKWVHLRSFTNFPPKSH